MNKKREQRTERLPEIRLTPSEKKAVMEEYKSAKYPNRATFIRAKILDKTYSSYKEKELEAEIAAGKLVTELNQLGNNINQIAKVLNTYKDGKIRQEELLVIGATAKLLLQIKEILTGATAI
ncbi:MAG: plasmid mobilization relaxosome protein MobC [Bacteroidota bacterium]